MAADTLTEETKRCRKCQTIKPSHDFRANAKVSGGLHSWCRACSSDAARRTYAKYPGRYRYDKPVPRKLCTVCGLDEVAHQMSYCSNDCARLGQRTSLYNLSPRHIIALYELQLWRCAICDEPTKLNEIEIDHDHNTGKVRGLLCETCNKGIGMLADSADRVRGALAYLEARASF